MKSFKKLKVSEAFLRLHCSALSGKTQRKKIIWWDNALLASKAKISDPTVRVLLVHKVRVRVQVYTLSAINQKRRTIF